MIIQNATRPGSNEQTWHVINNGHVIGVITKYRDTRTDFHPYKVFRVGGKLIGFVYKASVLAKHGVSNDKMIEMTEFKGGYAPTYLGDRKFAAKLLLR